MSRKTVIICDNCTEAAPGGGHAYPSGWLLISIKTWETSPDWSTDHGMQRAIQKDWDICPDCCHNVSLSGLVDDLQRKAGTEK